MKNEILRAALALLATAALAACSGASNGAPGTPAPADSAAPAASGPGGHHGEHKGEHHGEHKGEHHRPKLTPALAGYHEVLRPLWHAEPGAAREQRTCEQAATLTEKARAVSAEAAPAGVAADRWTAAAQKLASTTGDLRQSCEAAARTGIPARLEAAHTAFHQIMELVPPPPPPPAGSAPPPPPPAR